MLIGTFAVPLEPKSSQGLASYNDPVEVRRVANPRPRNAFDRARDAVLAFDMSWWDALQTGMSKAAPGAEISEPEFLWLGEEMSGLGRHLLERRTITLPKRGRKKATSWTITRAAPIRFSTLPLDVLEGITRDLLDQSEAEWRQANIENVVAFAQSFGQDDALEIAEMALGPDATKSELEAYGASIMPVELLEGGEAAAKFFDEAISVASIGEDEEGSLGLVPEPPPPPGIHPLDVGEWDFYSPEEVVDYEGPHSDPAYAFRVVRLCEALREDPDRAVQIAMLLGAVTREWEIWRENDEFLNAGRAHFAEQSRLARSKREKPWMAQVRADVEANAIGPNIAAYARKLQKRRDLVPPSTERIRNYVSQLRAEESAAHPSQ
jgi:hypothetical protein